MINIELRIQLTELLIFWINADNKLNILLFSFFVSIDTTVNIKKKRMTVKIYHPLLSYAFQCDYAYCNHSLPL